MDPRDESRIARPTIEQVFAEYLTEERKRLSERTSRRYEDVIALLSDSLNGYAYDTLAGEEKELFHRLYNAEDSDHREFTEIFGPEHILPNLDEFFDYFMIRKVLASEELLRAAGTVTKKLAKWLANRGYADQGVADDASERAAAAARDLPAAEALSRLLAEYSEGTKLWAESIEDHFTISGTERGEIWLVDLAGRGFGPFRLPAEVVKRCPVGWSFSGVIGRRGKSWFLSEVWNVYP